MKTHSRSTSRLDETVAKAQRDRATREQGYRAKALKMYPWVCGRCEREFDHSNVSELTVHHRNHDHDDNPEDGSNWELLCLYCHDNEHSRYIDGDGVQSVDSETEAVTHKPFADLAKLLGR